MGRGGGSHPRDRCGLLMNMIEAASLVGHPLGFEPTRSGVGGGAPGAGFGRAEPPPRQVKRIPPHPQAATGHGREDDQDDREHHPAGRGGQT